MTTSRSLLFLLLIAVLIERSSGWSVANRRQILIAGWISTTIESTADQQTIRKPFAPVQALIPAARVKKTIDQAVSVAKNTNNYEELPRLLSLELDSKQQRKQPSQPAQAYLEKYNQKRAYLSLTQKPGALLVEKGEIDAWKRLRRQEQSREQADPVRAAFNLYTDSLTFSSQNYILNVPKDVRSQLIRDDKLPDVSSVVNADLDLRYLYRNQVLNDIADVQAELGLDEPDRDEVVRLLESAQTATNQWFSFIDEKDVQEAMNNALQ